MNDRTMIKVRCDKELLYIRTISWEKKSPHRFAILRSELQKLEQEPNKRVLTSDCGSFASLRLTKGPDGTQILEIRFTWLQEDGNDRVHGWKEDVRLPYEPFRAFAGAGEDMDGAEWRQLSIPELVTRRYEFRCRKNLQEVMETDEMELDTIGDRKTALFVIISDTDDTFNFVVSILYTQLFNLLCDKADDEYGGRLPVHVRCLLDEFANIGQIPKFEKLIATIRSREISASIILQSQSQLKAIYKDNADTIVGNCDTTLFLGGKEKTTLKEISEILGKETIDSFNTSETRGRELSHGLNYQKLGKQLMTEDEIAVMDGGKCILQLRGVRPFFSDKFDITKHPKYKYLSDADPKNAFDMEKHLKRRPAIVKPDEVFDYYEIDAADLQEDADHEET